MKNSDNPSIIRSRQMLINALLELMETKNFRDITITELVKKADLVRKTFYRNFSSKEEIIDVYVDELFKEYFSQLYSLEKFDLYSAILKYFEFWKENYIFLRLLWKNDMMLYVLRKYDDFLPLIGKQFQNIEISNNAAYQYEVAYSAGGYWYLLCKWIERGAVETPREMAEIYINCNCFFDTMLND